ncbi:TIGR03621 family F420-dependent LLM class oxidoreductase [Mycolicibacterium vanbaalenii]|uniref:TIGR03621 family F420-dependent LLM class oxidoreductase n=1 Tax=Mycolicibacterium vanbaalenii TaxID=110539 RepID=UPI001F2E028A|nr:TIGR03621 family F420-dependent LLM class oxidoreductase [Mycolicibacterium vanbaalenii]UJL29040.1 TIGR03621 family F420-dependent LLM class oxidoreductase [Mycolicibacterium vanbaalenii]WND55762.1 TIGR03621 family F420-dependent LLM class oxidoreductase [Mycolicibacterium vanbaalenii]
MATEFRFGVGVTRARSRAELVDSARRAEDLGFDVLHVPDHLGGPAPFPVMTTIAMATTTLRVGTFVINSAFYRPALLARDVAALHDLSEGRFELGLGTGYVKEEFDAAGIPFPSARERVDHLKLTTEHMTEHLPDVPIMIAGNGDRVLRIAARSADIIGFTGGDRAATADEDPLADRIAFVRDAAGERFGDLELNLAVTAMPVDDSGRPDLTIPRISLPGLSDEELLRHPGVLSGSVDEIADRIRGYRDVYGINYLIVQMRHAEAFGKVIELLQ